MSSTHYSENTVRKKNERLCYDKIANSYNSQQSVNREGHTFTNLSSSQSQPYALNLNFSQKCNLSFLSTRPNIMQSLIKIHPYFLEIILFTE